MEKQDDKDAAGVAPGDGEVGTAGGGAEAGAAPAAHEPVSCPEEKCGAPAGTSWPWASDQGAAIELYGKCLGCLVVGGELDPQNETDEKRLAILKLANERGVSPEQAMEPSEIDIGTAILMKLDELQQEVRMLRRENGATRLGVGALIRMQTGGSAELPEQIVKALGIDPAQAESEAVRSNLSAGVAGVDPSKLRRGGGFKH